MVTAKKVIPVKPPTRRPAARKVAAPRATAKPVAKSAPSAKPAAAAKPAPAPKAVKAPKPEKPKKPKLVRDSFTIPKTEYLVLDELKQRGARLGSPAKKSEVLRAGLKALAAMSDVAFLASLSAVPAIKTGRPGKLG